MMEVLHRYRLFIIVISLILFILLFWLFLSGQNAGKVPSRGVFVIRELMNQRFGKW